MTTGEEFILLLVWEVRLTSCFNSYYRPNLRKYYERIGAMEKTKEVLEGQSPAGSMAQYFVAGPLH